MRTRVLAGIILGFLLMGSGVAFACDICEGSSLLGLEWCVIAKENETGYSECHTVTFFDITVCVVGGDFCTNMTIGSGGGGSGGGTGSGGTSCQRPPGGSCPASCASCAPAGNPGGMPRI